MTIPLISLTDIVYHHEDGTPALNGLTLTIGKGKKLALLGANGSGKTTLLLHLNGLLQPRSGTLSLEGEPVEYNRRFLQNWRRRVGLILQNPDEQLFAGSTWQDISYGPLNLGLPENECRHRVEKVLNDLDIEHLANRPPHLLSFGQIKRVAIAGILAMEPELLLLDEPTAGLDPAGAHRLMNTLENRHRAGTTLAIATHDVDLAFTWADQVAILDNDALLHHGPTVPNLSDPDLLQRCNLPPPTILNTLVQLQRLGWLNRQAPASQLMDEFLRKTALASVTQHLKTPNHEGNA